MKKRIIFVTEALWIGGIETALVNLLKSLDYEKYDVTCLILRNDQTMAPRLAKQVRLLVADRHDSVSFPNTYRWARLYHLTEESSSPSLLHKAMMWAVPAIKWVENRLYIHYICENLKNEHFDTCVIYSDRTAETAVRAIRADKYLMFYHHGAMRREYHDEIGYQKSERIIAVSNAIEQKLRVFRPKYAYKMITIQNLVDLDDIWRKAVEPVPEVFSPDMFHIVSCGRVSREKGMDLAVEACAELVTNGCEYVHWWIVGGGPAEQEVRIKIASLHMENHVTLLGMKPNPYPYIKRADLYVQPSRFESYGLTIAEAIALGRPIVSTDTDGARALICHEKNGFLCSIDGQGIASSIAEHLKNPHTVRNFPDILVQQNYAIMQQIALVL